MCHNEDVWNDRNTICELRETTLDGEPAYEFKFGSSGLICHKKSEFSIEPKVGDQLEWSKLYREEQQQEFDKYMETADEKYAALPKCLQKSIDTMRASDNADTRFWEPYDMFAFQEGVKIAAVVTSEEEIFAFRKLSWKNQKTLVPDLSEDHSGGTFSTAIAAALDIVRTPD